ncbi:uncharacterized protein LOC121382733 [Gigantopelta aegis]|uniref:uncharacterized protein LOC121382733 n=1 Tax=Gigantopelta aegis TaxID=1735272 RepID=UPI001B88C885|nr:uncharacterized protein LOC121382733 [Gigantopelta aegis]
MDKIDFRPNMNELWMQLKTLHQNLMSGNHCVSTSTLARLADVIKQTLTLDDGPCSNIPELCTHCHKLLMLTNVTMMFDNDAIRENKHSSLQCDLMGSPSTDKDWTIKHQDQGRDESSGAQKQTLDVAANQSTDRDWTPKHQDEGEDPSAGSPGQGADGPKAADHLSWRKYLINSVGIENLICSLLCLLKSSDKFIRYGAAKAILSGFKADSFHGHEEKLLASILRDLTSDNSPQPIASLDVLKCLMSRKSGRHVNQLTAASLKAYFNQLCSVFWEKGIRRLSSGVKLDTDSEAILKTDSGVKLNTDSEVKLNTDSEVELNPDSEVILNTRSPSSGVRLAFLCVLQKIIKYLNNQDESVKQTELNIILPFVSNSLVAFLFDQKYFGTETPSKNLSDLPLLQRSSKSTSEVDKSCSDGFSYSTESQSMSKSDAVITIYSRLVYKKSLDIFNTILCYGHDLSKKKCLTEIHHIYVTLSVKVLSVVSERGLSRVPYTSQFVGFGGTQFESEDLAGDYMQHGDSALLRKLFLLLFKMCAVSRKSRQEELKGSMCLQMVTANMHVINKFVLDHLSVNCGDTSNMSWLPVVFCDQDDAWIETLLCLLDIYLSLPRNGDADIALVTTLNPHKLFLQFLDSTTNDHTVLVDLLTSPETCFLLYLIRYLKCVLTEWDMFVRVCHRTYCNLKHRNKQCHERLTQQNYCTSKHESQEHPVTVTLDCRCISEHQSHEVPQIERLAHDSSYIPDQSKESPKQDDPYSPDHQSNELQERLTHDSPYISVQSNELPEKLMQNNFCNPDHQSNELLERLTPANKKENILLRHDSSGSDDDDTLLTTIPSEQVKGRPLKRKANESSPNNSEDQIKSSEEFLRTIDGQTGTSRNVDQTIASNVDVKSPGFKNTSQCWKKKYKMIKSLPVTSPDGLSSLALSYSEKNDDSDEEDDELEQKSTDGPQKQICCIKIKHKDTDSKSFVLVAYDDDDDNNDEVQTEDSFEADSDDQSNGLNSKMEHDSKCHWSCVDQVLATFIRMRMKITKLYHHDLFPYKPRPLLTVLQQCEDRYELMSHDTQ